MDSHSTLIGNISVCPSWQREAIRQINHLGQAIVSYLSQQNQPQITQKVHWNGHIVWHIYDPYSDQHITCASQAEVWFWLEKRHCH